MKPKELLQVLLISQKIGESLKELIIKGVVKKARIIHLSMIINSIIKIIKEK